MNKRTLKEIMTKELMQTLVLDAGADIDELEEMLGASERTIRRSLREHGIPLKLVRKTSSMSVEDSKHLAEKIKIPQMMALEKEYYNKDAEPEVVHIMLSDLQVGQKLPTESTERAMQYFRDAFVYFTENIFKVLGHVMNPFKEINIHLNGDLMEGEGIYHNQAFDSFHLKDQIEITTKGLLYIIDSLKTLGIPIKIYSTRGNHGRTGWKTADESNWDTVLARMLGIAYRNDNQVEVTISHNKHMVSTNKYGHRIMQTHGDYIPMYMSLPYYGMDKMIGGWVNIYGRIAAVLCGHYHVSSRIRPAGVPAFLNGCWRINDFPIDKMARVSTRCQWIFGSSKERAITWSYEVDTEPPQYKKDLETYLMQVDRV